MRASRTPVRRDKPVAPLDTTFDAEWRARFERFARRYEADWDVSGWSEVGLERRLRQFAALLPTLCVPHPGLALDLGCGAGTYVRLLAAAGHRAIGLDYSLPSLGRALAGDPRGAGRYVAGEAYALPFPRETFDLVVCIGVLQALSTPERALDEMLRILCPGGKLVFEALNGRATPARLKRWRDAVRGLPPRVRSYDPRQVEAWLDDRGLEAVRLFPVYLPPRRMPSLARLLELAPLARVLDGRLGMAMTMAHSFLFVACKTGEDKRSRR